MSPLAFADLYGADDAYRKQDFARSFELYGELARLGRREAQENLAIMYVNGEGVKRDNVLGYAWAVIARENGGGEAMQNIIAQLDRHMTAAARSRVAEVQAQFGSTALRERLLPSTDLPPSPAAADSPTPSNRCSLSRPVNPDDYYPADAVRQGYSGVVTLEVTVAPDGHARDAHILYAVPAKVFDEAGQRVALASGYVAPRVDGIAVACKMRFRVKFSIRVNGVDATNGGSLEQRNLLADVRAKAEAGDPRSQMAYGLMLEVRSDMNVEKEPSSPWYLRAAQGGIPTAQYFVAMNLLVAPQPDAAKEAAKGLVWLQRAADAGQSDAQTALANYMMRVDPAVGSVDKAQALLEKAAASGNRDGRYYLAALLATGPDATRRDPDRALALINEVFPEVDVHPSAFEIRAAAEAMLGDYAAAQKDQAKALAMARKLSWNAKDQQARLASYMASKPWTGDLFAF